MDQHRRTRADRHRQTLLGPPWPSPTQPRCAGGPKADLKTHTLLQLAPTHEGPLENPGRLSSPRRGCPSCFTSFTYKKVKVRVSRPNTRLGGPVQWILVADGPQSGQRRRIIYDHPAHFMACQPSVEIGCGWLCFAQQQHLCVVVRG